MRNTSQTILKLPDPMLDYIIGLLRERPHRESDQTIQTLVGQANDTSIQNMVENAPKSAVEAYKAEVVAAKANENKPAS